MKNAFSVSYGLFLALPPMERPTVSTVLPSLRTRAAEVDYLSDPDITRDIADLVAEERPRAMSAVAR